MNNKLTIFAGAGISSLSNYPTCKELTNEFTKKLGIKEKGDNKNYG